VVIITFIYDRLYHRKALSVLVKRLCLNLIRDTPTLIQEELDLINSLALLDDFGVSIIPAQGT
jgi:hypothetical protein